MVSDVAKCISLDFLTVSIRSSSYIDSQTNFNIGDGEHYIQQNGRSISDMNTFKSSNILYQKDIDHKCKAEAITSTILNYAQFGLYNLVNISSGNKIHFPVCVIIWLLFWAAPEEHSKKCINNLKCLHSRNIIGKMKFVVTNTLHWLRQESEKTLFVRRESFYC